MNAPPRHHLDAAPHLEGLRAVTPRMVTLVGTPSVRRGLLPTTTISGEAQGRPSSPVATRESTTILLRWSRGTQEVSSDAEPRWTTMAFLGDPGRAQGAREARPHGQQGHEHRDHEGDPDHREQAHLPAAADVADVVGEGEGHGARPAAACR